MVRTFQFWFLCLDKQFAKTELAVYRFIQVWFPNDIICRLQFDTKLYSLENISLSLSVSSSVERMWHWKRWLFWLSYFHSGILNNIHNKRYLRNKPPVLVIIHHKIRCNFRNIASIHAPFSWNKFTSIPKLIEIVMETDTTSMDGSWIKSCK